MNPGLLAALLAGCEPTPPAPAPEAPIASNPSLPPTTVVEAAQEGVRIRLEATVLERGEAAEDALQHGDLARIRLQISDDAGLPLSGLGPAAWLGRAAGRHADETCTERAQGYLGGSLLARAELDLNVFYVLTLNDDPTVSVVDPLFGFGGSKLLDLITLSAPGMDWDLSPDGQVLAVAEPGADRLELFSVDGWSRLSSVPLPAPDRVLFSPDGGLIWATWADRWSAGISTHSGRDGRALAQQALGAGPYTLASSSDGRRLFAAEAGAGKVAVFDAFQQRLITEVPVCASPVSVTWSERADAALVSCSEGKVVTVDRDGRVRGEAPATAGLGQIAAAPDSRFALLLNRENRDVYVFDAAIGRVVQQGRVWGTPMEVAFSETLAYVRHADTALVLMLPTTAFGVAGAPLEVVDFPAGEKAPGSGKMASNASQFAMLPGAGATLIANPGDEHIYYYQEGMAAPMGSFENFQREPRSVRVVDRALRERSPGRYETVRRLPAPGRYLLTVYLDSPRTVACLPVEIAPNAQDRDRIARAVLFSPLLGEADAAGRVRLRVGAQSAEGAPVTGLKDLNVRLILPPGTWFKTAPGAEVEPGVYEASFEAPTAGVYGVYTSVPSRGIDFGAPLLWLPVNPLESKE